AYSRATTARPNGGPNHAVRLRRICVTQLKNITSSLSVSGTATRGPHQSTEDSETRDVRESWRRTTASPSAPAAHQLPAPNLRKIPYLKSPKTSSAFTNSEPALSQHDEPGDPDDGLD